MSSGMIFLTERHSTIHDEKNGTMSSKDLLINLYNANKESEQLNTILTLCNLLNDITNLHCKNTILGGDFNVFLI